jgi:hypothetical protein
MFGHRRLVPAPRGFLRVLAGLCGLLLMLPSLRSQVLATVSPTDSDPVVYTSTSPAGPLRWRGCGPIRVLVNPGPFGDPARREIAAAFDEVATLTGLDFVLDLSDAVPTTTWARSTGGVPPVLIGWVTPSQTDLFSAAAGATVANPSGTGTGRGIVTGAIGLNAERRHEFVSAPGPGQTVRNLLLHEIGHLLGLGHSEHAVLMNPVVGESSPDGFSPAEAEALSVLYSDCR